MCGVQVQATTSLDNVLFRWKQSHRELQRANQEGQPPSRLPLTWRALQDAVHWTKHLGIYNMRFIGLYRAGYIYILYVYRLIGLLIHTVYSCEEGHNILTKQPFEAWSRWVPAWACVSAALLRCLTENCADALMRTFALKLISWLSDADFHYHWSWSLAGHGISRSSRSSGVAMLLGIETWWSLHAIEQ